MISTVDSTGSTAPGAGKSVVAETCEATHDNTGQTDQDERAPGEPKTRGCLREPGRGGNGGDHANPELPGPGRG